MSAASTPAPRAKNPNERSSPPRHTLFLPLLILLLGMGTLELYEVMSMEEQLDMITQDNDRMDAKVKLAQYEKDKFYTMAAAVLRMAPKDPNADQVATLFGLRQLQIDKPELMNASQPSDLPTDMPPSSTKGTTPDAAPATNAAPQHPTAPAAK